LTVQDHAAEMLIVLTDSKMEAVRCSARHLWSTCCYSYKPCWKVISSCQ